MKVESEKDFTELRRYIEKYYKKFPMFRHDIVQIEKIVEEHIKQYSIAMVYYRQNRNKSHLEKAQKEIEKINDLISIIGKIELMAILSQS